MTYTILNYIKICFESYSHVVCKQASSSCRMICYFVKRETTYWTVTGSYDRYTGISKLFHTHAHGERWWKSSFCQRALPRNLAGRWNKTSEESRETEKRQRRQEQWKHWSVVQFVCTNWLQFLHLSATTHQKAVRARMCVCILERFFFVFFSSKAASLFLAQ